MRVLPIVAMLGCGSPMHAVDAPAADTAIPDAPVDAAAPVKANHQRGRHGLGSGFTTSSHGAASSTAGATRR
ncbi:MAG TPA: hypothetical protein VF516_28965 [Kofleriaceae bacterium]